MSAIVASNSFSFGTGSLSNHAWAPFSNVDSFEAFFPPPSPVPLFGDDYVPESITCLRRASMATMGGNDQVNVSVHPAQQDRVNATNKATTYNDPLLSKTPEDISQSLAMREKDDWYSLIGNAHDRGFSAVVNPFSNSKRNVYFGLPTFTSSSDASNAALGISRRMSGVIMDYGDNRAVKPFRNDGDDTVMQSMNWEAETFPPMPDLAADDETPESKFMTFLYEGRWLQIPGSDALQFDTTSTDEDQYDDEHEHGQFSNAFSALIKRELTPPPPRIIAALPKRERSGSATTSVSYSTTAPAPKKAWSRPTAPTVAASAPVPTHQTHKRKAPVDISPRNKKSFKDNASSSPTAHSSAPSGICSEAVLKVRSRAAETIFASAPAGRISRSPTPASASAYSSASRASSESAYSVSSASSRGKRVEGFPCPKCPFVCQNAGDLPRHMERRDHQEAAYRCHGSNCGKSFTRVDARRRHLKNSKGCKKMHDEYRRIHGLDEGGAF